MGGRGSKYDSAGDIVGQYDISMITDSKKKIVDFYSAIEKNGGIREEDGRIKIKRSANDQAVQLAEELADRISYRDEEALEDYRGIQNIIGGPMYMSDYDRANIADIGAYLRSGDNFVRLSRDATRGIDSVYQELAETYPQYFDDRRVSSTADQLLDINRVLKGLKNSSIPLSGSDRAEAVADLRKELIYGYITVRRKSA